MVHGGQNPIVEAHVYLYAANTTGYGNASISLLQPTSGTVEDINGNYYYPTQSGGKFNIAGDFTCPSAGSQVYLYAVGGDPGLGDGTNSAIGLMAALGTCGALSSDPYVVINEISTVATAYAIAGFAVDSTHVSSSSLTAGDGDGRAQRIRNGDEPRVSGQRRSTGHDAQLERSGAARHDRHNCRHSGSMHQLGRADVDAMRHAFCQRNERKFAARRNGDGSDQYRA